MIKMMMVIVFGLIVATNVCADVTSNSVVAVADAYANSAAPTATFGGNEYLWLRSWDKGDGTFDADKVYLRFVVPSNADEISSANLSFVNIEAESGSSSFKLYGLSKSASGQDWTETVGISWNDAPANDTASVSELTSDATVLADITWGPSAVGDVLTIPNTAELVDFLNTCDAGDAVTLILTKYSDTGGNVIKLASRENSTYEAPTLQLDYTLLPTITAVADAYANSAAPAVTFGGNEYLWLRSWDKGDGTFDADKVYLRFVVPSNADEISSANLSFVNIEAESGSSSFKLYGLSKSASGQDWTETVGISWNDAPANDTASISELTSDAAVLADITWGPSAVGDVLTIPNTAELVDFLNTCDAGDAVTLILTKYSDTGGNVIKLASRENSMYEAPTLQLDYTLLPTITAVADAYANSAGPTNTYGVSEELWLRSWDKGDGIFDADKVYLRFNLPSNMSVITSANLSFVNIEAEAGSSSFNLYGLDKSALGQNWTETDGISWSDAPANDTNSMSDLTSDATVLADITWGPTAIGDILTISSTTELVDFLNTYDAGDAVTLILTKYSDTGGNVIKLASRENSTYQAPTLTLSAEYSLSEYIFSITQEAGSFVIVADGMPQVGTNFLQFCTDLVNPAWTNINEVTGVSSNSWTISTLSDNQGFYRVQTVY